MAWVGPLLIIVFTVSVYAVYAGLAVKGMRKQSLRTLLVLIAILYLNVFAFQIGYAHRVIPPAY